MAVTISREALAHRVGVAVGDVDRLVETGLIGSDGASTFTGGDVWRARFLRGLEQGGIPLEAVAEVVRNGDLSFDFFDDDYWDRFGGLSDATFADVSKETGLGHDLLAAVRESSGYAKPSPEDRVRMDEFDAIELLKVTIASGVSAEAAESHLRVWGENLSRIADADATFWHEQVEVPMLEAGLSQSQMLAATGEVSGAVAPLLDPALLSTYHARSEPHVDGGRRRGGRGDPGAGGPAPERDPSTRDVLPGRERLHRTDGGAGRCGRRRGLDPAR